MKRKMLSPILLALLAATAIVPSLPRAYAFHGGAHLSLDPILLSGDPGNVLVVTLYVSDVMDLVAYDVEVNYNTAALSASCEFDAGTVFDGMAPFPVVSDCNEGVGSLRSAQTLLGGLTKDVFGPEPVMIITFTVDATVDTLVTINPDSALVSLVGGELELVPYEIQNSEFLAPPQAELHRWDASVSQSDRNKFLSNGETSLTLVGTVRMTNKATRGGYAFIVFDIIDPSGVLVAQVQSETIFINPGEIMDTTAPYEFPATLGRYEIFATLWRGASLDFFVAGESISGAHFFVHF